jgi:hypothetical protein
MTLLFCRCEERDSSLTLGTGSAISWWGKGLPRFARNDIREGTRILQLELAGGFILGAEASGADVDFSFLSFYHNRSSVNIR